MKKTFVRICSIAAIGLALTACNNDAANKTAQDADNSAIEQLVQDKLNTLGDSLNKACEEKVTLAATAKLEAEAPKGGTTAAAKPKPKPKPTPAKKEEPKAPDPKSTTTRPGATNNTTPASTTNRPGANTNDKPKSTTNRPGATQN